MKNSFLFSMLVVLASLAQGQVCSSYLISVNGDTINCADQKKLKQGKWVVRVEELRGEPGYEEEGYFVDDKKEGNWRRYNLTGDLLAIENYKWGNRDGKQLYFTMLGDLLREESWKSVNPENPYDTIEVPDLDNPMVTVSKVIKHEASELRHGTWKMYDPTTGMIVKTETYLYGQKEGLASTGGNTGQPAKTKSAAPAAKPKAVEDWEKKNTGKKKVTVRDGRTGG
jgi:hypothetical protein